MHAIILAATHERVKNEERKEVPLVLVDLEGLPQLTVLTDRLSRVKDLQKIIIVTNEAIKPDLDEWASKPNKGNVLIRVVGDGTWTQEDRLGAIGDVLYALQYIHPQDDLILIGGNNWFKFDLADFVEKSRGNSPAVVVTSVDPRDLDAKHFGLAEMVENRIITFQEKPYASTLSLKASCVYYFSASDLKWLYTFSEEHNGKISFFKPGHFIAWLLDRGIPVYGFDARWHRLDPSSHDGPYFFKFREKIRQKFDTKNSTWEKPALQFLEKVDSLAEILSQLHAEDPNTRIVATMILGCMDDLLDSKQKDYVISALLNSLKDTSQNIPGNHQGDEEEIYFVSATAAESLVRLKYAEDEPSVYQKAREVGFNVEERKNVY